MIVFREESMQDHLVKLEEAKKELYEIIERFVISDRKGKLIEFIEKTTFLSDPASIRYHNALHGGLMLHCLQIAKIGINLNRALKFQIPEESIIICAILHDYCKVGTYKIGTRKVQDPQFANDRTKGYGWRAVNKYEYQKATDLPYGHGFKSLMLVFKNLGYQYLNEKEMESIAYHMGMFDDQSSSECMEVFKDNPLAYIIHVSDITAGLYYESDGEVTELIF